MHILYAYYAMTIEFDPDKAADNLKKHKVSFVDTEQVLRD